MSWTFTVRRISDATLLQATVRNPADGDLHSSIRRQAFGETESGALYVQDLQETQEFLDANWSGLCPSEKEALLEVFGEDGTRRRARTAQLSITNPPGAILRLGGAVVQDASGWSGTVRLEQSDLEFRHQQADRFALQLRFRVVAGPEANPRDYIYAADQTTAVLL